MNYEEPPCIFCHQEIKDQDEIYTFDKDADNPLIATTMFAHAKCMPKELLMKDIQRCLECDEEIKADMWSIGTANDRTLQTSLNSYHIECFKYEEFIKTAMHSGEPHYIEIEPPETNEHS